MPSFFKDFSIRRKSKVSIRTSDTDTGNSSSNDGVDDSRGPLQRPPHKSSSSLNLHFDPARQSPTPPLPSLSSSNTIPSLKSRTNSTSNLSNLLAKTPPVPPRPRLPSSNSNRYSLMSGIPTQNGDRPIPTTSIWAPRVLSVSDNSWVHQKILLINGQCGDAAQPVDGSLTVCHHQDHFPPTPWPVWQSHFKALVVLQPGPNRLRLDFTSPKLTSGNGSTTAHSSWINVNYLPLNSTPPLQLCILVAKDSPETYDAVPARAEKEGNNLATAIRKFRMAAYLWQAFTAEQMNRNGFGRRCYRYEEEWQPGTLTWRDRGSSQMRNEVKVHVIRLEKTVAEIQDLDIAQQYGPASRKGDLFGIASDAVRAHFAPRPGQPQYVSCMFLDSHWDKQADTVRGHAALGGGDDTLKLAIFGSHCLQSYPAHIEEVVPAFTDCTPTDTNYVANDCNESGSNWEAANIGIGAHLHETGHLLGCPHQESGVMLRDYTRLNRTFVSREEYSTRTNQPGLSLCLPKDECAWHRLDVLRFRHHPCFQLPTDQALSSDRSVQIWMVDHSSMLITAATGVAWIEIFPDGDDLCHHWMEYLDQSSSPAIGPRQITLTEQQVRERLPEDKRKRNFKVQVFSCGGGDVEISDFAGQSGSAYNARLPNGRPSFKSSKLGASEMDGSQPQEILLGTCLKKPKLLLTIRVFYGLALDGLEFIYEDSSTDLFGSRGGTPGGADFQLDTRRGEMLLGFHVRAGAWIDGIQIMTTTGRRSEIFGNASGGSGHTLIPPRGYSIAGVYGSSGSWVDGFGLIITR